MLSPTRRYAHHKQTCDDDSDCEDARAITTQNSETETSGGVSTTAHGAVGGRGKRRQSMAEKNDGRWNPAWDGDFSQSECSLPMSR